MIQNKVRAFIVLYKSTKFRISKVDFCRTLNIHPVSKLLHLEGALQWNETEDRKSPPQEVPYTIQDITGTIPSIQLTFVGPVDLVCTYVENGRKSISSSGNPIIGFEEFSK